MIGIASHHQLLNKNFFESVVKDMYIHILYERVVTIKSVEMFIIKADL